MTLISCIFSKRPILSRLLALVALIGTFHTLVPRPVAAYDWCSAGCLAPPQHTHAGAQPTLMQEHHATVHPRH